MRFYLLTSLLFLLTFIVPTWADQILLNNGDRLTGKIEQLVDGKLVFQSDLAGKVTVDVSNVETLSSDEPIRIHLNDGTVLNQKVSTAGPGRFVIEGGETLQAQEFDVTAISSINPPGKPEPKWKGNISGGLTSTHGNTQAESINASVSLAKRTEKDRIQLNADYARGRQVDPATGAKNTTENWWKTKAKYDYFFTKKFYGYVDGRYEMDSIALLDRRVVIGGGGGYQWIESDDMNLAVEAGLASLYEKFNNQANSNNELSFQLGYNVDKKLLKTVKFIHSLTYYPSTENFSDYYLTSSAEFRANFTETMFTNFKVIFDYDATPAVGAGSTDTKYILGVGLSF